MGAKNAAGTGAEPEDAPVPEDARPADIPEPPDPGSGPEDARPASGPAPADARPDRGRRHRVLIGTVLALTAVVTGFVLAFGLPDSDEPRPRPRPRGPEWSMTLPVRGDARCAADGNSVYCNGAGYDAIRIWTPTGQVRWKLPSAASGKALAPRVAPLGVRKDMVFAIRSHGPGAGSGANVAALDRRTGKQVWKQELADGPAAARTAKPGFGTLYAQTKQHPAMGGFDLKTGQYRWSTDHPAEQGQECTPVSSIYHPSFLCPPAPGGAPGTLRLVGVDPRSNHRYPLATLPRSTDFLGSRGGKLYFAEYRPEDIGKPVKRYTRVDVVNPLPPGEMPENLQPVRSHRLPETAARQPSFHDYSGIIAFPGPDGSVTAVQAAGGKTLWIFRPPPDMNAGSWGRRTPAVVMTMLGAHILTPDAELFAVDPADGTPLSRRKLALPDPRAVADAQPQLMEAGMQLVGRFGNQLVSVEHRIEERGM